MAGAGRLGRSVGIGLVRILAETIGTALVVVDPDKVVVNGPLAEDVVVAALVKEPENALDVGAVPPFSIEHRGDGAPVAGARSAAQELLIEAGMSACGHV